MAYERVLPPHSPAQMGVSPSKSRNPAVRPALLLGAHAVSPACLYARRLGGEGGIEIGGRFTCGSRYGRSDCQRPRLACVRKDSWTRLCKNSGAKSAPFGQVSV